MTLAATQAEQVQAENVQLRRELERAVHQRDVLAEVCQAQHALLVEIWQDGIVLNRHAWRAVAPQLREAPAASARALL